MGLLDSLFSGGGSGGLLDFLRNNALNQQFNSGLPSDQAQYGSQQPYGMFPQAMAQAPQGIPANPPAVIQAPPTAQPMQPQTAAPQPDAGPPMGDRLSAGFNNLNSGGNPITALANVITGFSTGQRFDKAGIAQQAANQTARALLAKNVDPQTVQAAISNPVLMEALIKQTYGPHNIQSIGNGYVYDPIKGTFTRAYEPEDKIPSGYRKKDNGDLEFIPGGPADPKHIQEEKTAAPFVLGNGSEAVKYDKDGNLIVIHRNEPDSGMTQDAIDVMARREIGGDFSGRKNIGRGAQGAKTLEALNNRATDILTNEMGMKPADAAAYLSKKKQEFEAQGVGLNAESRTSAVREANLNLILRAADAAIPSALEASDKVSRTGWVPLNKIIQGGQVIASDPDLKKFGMANLQLAEHWARAMNPTGVMRESDRDKALSFLSTADSNKTYREAVDQLRTQIQRERDAVRSTRGMATMPGVTSPENKSAPNLTGKTKNGISWGVIQ